MSYHSINGKLSIFQNTFCSSIKKWQIPERLMINRRHNVYYLLIYPEALLFSLNKRNGATKLMHVSTLAIKKRSQIVTQPVHINT